MKITGSNTRLTGTEPINPGDGGLNSGSNKSALIKPTNSNTAPSSGDHISENVPGSAPQSDPDNNPAYSEGGFTQLYHAIYL